MAIFASGGGSNAEAIIRHFKEVPFAEVVLIVTNNENAGVLSRAKTHDIASYVHSIEAELDDSLLQLMREKEIDFIVLAGYLRKVNPKLVDAFNHKMVNVHPALLPEFGGKGMYGMNVHKAVVEANASISGPTIHYVNNNYDEGDIIAQFKCELAADDSAEDVQAKVLALEHVHYPKVIEQLLKDL